MFIRFIVVLNHLFSTSYNKGLRIESYDSRIIKCPILWC
ncbi:hypothetical protein NARC_110008 [Candidatus Nitrosocosmicus arcticus]|uniref:Uncharacterized protein n=1 Tax=Candidatus Nitrosocosmicus arcticus TaxID=2035267 RepID=A0A557ST60_9ARCH|nr:hypothetical protein NARC_110008 [Candidatus Nitrosocosmicus arcticus]